MGEYRDGQGGRNIDAAEARRDLEVASVAVSVGRIEVDDPRAEKMTRLNAEYGWWGAYVRSSKQFHGYRARGPQMDRVECDDGRVLTDYQPNQWSYTCWKDNYRAYQAHGRISGEASC